MQRLNRGGSLALHTACSHRNNIDVGVVSFLLAKYPRACRVPNDFGWLPLHAACAHGASAAIIELLLQSYPQACHCTTHVKRETPLHLAATADIVNVLLKFGANVAALDDQGRLALFVAKERGQDDIVNT